jgi:hypothetical protein
VARNNGLPAELPELLEELRQAAEKENGRAIREKLGKLIPHCQVCSDDQ